MTGRLISSGSPMEAQAGYSRALVDGSFVYVSGTTGFDYTGMKMPDGIEAQTRNIFSTIANVLEEAGSSMNQVLRVRYYVSDREYANPVMTIAGEVFGAIRPAATLVICGLLREDMLVEIEVTARVG